MNDINEEKKQLKIGFIYYKYPLYPGGSYFQRFLNYFAKSVKQVCLITACYPNKNFEKQENIKIFWVPLLNIKIIGDIFFMFTALLRAVFAKELDGINAINVVGLRGLLAGWYLKKRYQIPLICTIEMLNEKSSLLNSLQYKVAHFLLTKIPIDKIICWSNYYYEQHLKKWGLPNDKVIIIAPGIDIQFYNQNIKGEEIRKKYTPNHPLIVFAKPLYSTNTEAAKILVETLALLAPQIKIELLIGNGGGKKQVENLAEKLGVQNSVHFMPKMVPFVDIPKYIAAADLIVLPFTYSPTVSRSLLEAMALGKAVITNPTGEIKEIFHHQEEIFFSELNPKNIAEAICFLLSNPQMISSLGERARAVIVEKFSKKTYTQNVLAIIEELIDQKLNTKIHGFNNNSHL